MTDVPENPSGPDDDRDEIDPADADQDAAGSGREEDVPLITEAGQEPPD